MKAALSLLLATGCSRPSVEGDATDGSSTTDATPPADSTTGTDPDPADTTATEGPMPRDVPLDECEPGRLGCTDRLDVLLVVDNSHTMAHEQAKLARAMPSLVQALQHVIDDADRQLDVQVMVTTTDVGNPLCDPFAPPGYEPALGTPLGTPCTERLPDFTDPSGTISAPEACLDACPSPIAPEDPFVAFGPMGSNVPDAPPLDVDGDGTLDPPEAQALACLVPPGINGCGYESPLEAMRQALDPAAAHNQGPRPFLRSDALLSVVIVTDEADCSVADPTLMSDPAVQNVDPETGAPAPSSAICWNAGVECDPPDEDGVYPSCWSRSEPRMHAVEGHVEFLREDLQRDVMMVQLVGVPEVVEHSIEVPFQPIAGGELELVYRDFVDVPYPGGDIPPTEWAQGIRAAHKRFEIGIAPGCTAYEDGVVTAQATPPVRLLEA